MGAILKKKKRKKLALIISLVFSQSKSEPKLFHNYAKFSDFISLVTGLPEGSPRKRTYTIITRLCASYNTQ